MLGNEAGGGKVYGGRERGCIEHRKRVGGSRKRVCREAVGKGGRQAGKRVEGDTKKTEIELSPPTEMGAEACEI